jgi:hypothetical protein
MMWRRYTTLRLGLLGELSEIYVKMILRRYIAQLLCFFAFVVLGSCSDVTP